MVRPTKPKDMKPKADGVASESSGGGLNASKLIVVNTITTLLICLMFIGANYFVQDKLLTSKLATSAPNADGEGDAAAGDAKEENQIQRGIILDLGEFILNLSDPNARRYLKVNVAVELTRKETDPSPEASEGGGGHGGHGGEGAADPMKAIEEEMDQFKPAVRDAIISTLSSKTAEELSSVAGKELAKEQIKESVNGIFEGEREVIRVSFGNFIIQ